MNLREARARKMLTVRDLAKRVNISESNLYHIEYGEWLPSLKTARNLAAALEVDPNEVDELRAAIEKASKRQTRKR